MSDTYKDDRYKRKNYRKDIWGATPPTSYRKMWRRLCRAKIKKQSLEENECRINRLTSIYDWY